MRDFSFVTNPEVGTLLAFVFFSVVWLGIVSLLGAIFNPRPKELGVQIFAPLLLASGLSGIMVVVFLIFTARSFGDGASGCFLGFMWWNIMMFFSHAPAWLVVVHRDVVALKQGWGSSSYPHGM